MVPEDLFTTEAPPLIRPPLLVSLEGENLPELALNTQSLTPSLVRPLSSMSTSLIRPDFRCIEIEYQ
jgi:hypothetical protein